MSRHSSRPTVIAAALVAAAVAYLGALVSIANGALDETILVSRADGLGPNGGDNFSGDPSVSADGRFVAFTSLATNLSGDDVDPAPNPFDPHHDIFVRDTVANTTILVSRQTGTAPMNGANANSESPAITRDGRFVAFYSKATNLSDDDVDATYDIFVRDLVANTTTLVSRQTGTAPMNGADGSSFSPDISNDGRFVTFFSAADNLSTDDVNAHDNVFVRDLVANTTTLVSRQTGTAPMNGADAASRGPSISADGSRVSFFSASLNLSDDDEDDTFDIFLRDLGTNTTTLVSRMTGTAAQNGANGSSEEASLSADGRFVAFSSSASNLSSNDGNNLPDIYLRDTLANTTTRISRQTGTDPANGTDFDSYAPSISADGRFVAFSSYASNLSGDDKSALNVFVRDTQSNTTILISRESGTAPMNGGDDTSLSPSISDDGRFVAYGSTANNLSTEDTDAYYNVFLRQFREFPQPPSALCMRKTATRIGTARRDVITGTAGRDVIAGLRGNDLIRGRGGNDLVCGGAGKDKAIGGAGKDRLLGQAGADRLLGGAGRDRLLGGAGRDRLLGGGGRDKLAGGPGKDVQKQ